MVGKRRGTVGKIGRVAVGTAFGTEEDGTEQEALQMLGLQMQMVRKLHHTGMLLGRTPEAHMLLALEPL